MTYLLTGSNGFLGSHVRTELENLLPRNKICLLSSAHVDGYSTILRDGGDIKLTDFAIGILEDVTHLIHIGSFMPKRRDELNRFDLALESINFTMNLLLLPMPKLEKITYLSTVDVYSRNVTPMSETSETFSSNAYTAMKLFCEKMIDEFCKGNKVHLDILRSGHLYGEGDDVFNKLIPNIFRSLFGDYEFELQNGPRQELNLFYVKDAAKIICKVAHKDFGGGVTNLVSSHPVTLSYLLETIQLITSKRLKVKQISRYTENSRYSFQPSRLHERVEFVETPLETGLREVCKLWESRQK